jgi:3-demethoxyubiquinol 3-hydroxylase
MQFCDHHYDTAQCHRYRFGFTRKPLVNPVRLIQANAANTMNSNDLLCAADATLRTLFAPARSVRPCPTPSVESWSAGPDVSKRMSAPDRQLSGALMRVNHVGEVCAQALYTAQALATSNPGLRAELLAASAEETDHLAWTAQRLKELGSRPSLLNPLWYAGAFAIGFAAGKLGGDAVSLGFVLETERQVEAHLQSHLGRLPAADLASRAIVAQMQADEARHADQAQASGASPLPAPIQNVMRVTAQLMTTIAHRI